MNGNYIREVMKKIDAKARALDAELDFREIQVLRSRLTFLWEPVQSNASDVTKWRRGRSRRLGYEKVQDIDNHLFLAVLLSINPTECGQTKFQPVVNHLRSLGHYEAYHFTPKETTTKALHALADKHHIASNNRYRRLVDGLSKDQEEEVAMRMTVPATIEYAFSQVPMERLQQLPSFIMEAISSSSKFSKEMAQGEAKTACVNIFLRPREEDGSIIITVGSRTLHKIRNALAMSEWDINKT